MNLNEYFSDPDDEGKVQRIFIDALMRKSGEIPVGCCAVYSTNEGKVDIIDGPSETEKVVSDFEALAKREARFGKTSGVVIRSNGRPFLNVGIPFDTWTRTYKMPGHDVFILEVGSG